MSHWLTTSSQFFSYYPKYEYLDNLLSITNRKRMNIFVDVKGCAQALYQEWAVKHIISQSRSSNMVDTSLFSGILEFIAFHKKYARKRQIDLRLYFFMEKGKSSYHLNLHKDYKAARGTGDFFDLDLETRDFFFKVLDKNYIVSERVVNKIPNASFISLKYLEADFIPWYLMQHVLSKEEMDNSTNIIYSTDKDMLQCLIAPNIFQFYRHYKNIEMISYKDIYSRWLKEELPIDDPASWFPLALSINGDSSDGIDGVKGIGPKTIIKVFSDVMTICGSMDKVYDNVLKNKPIFSDYKVNNKSLKKIIDHQNIIIRNLKLISFKLLSDYLNGGFPTDTIDKKKQIFDCVENTNKCSSAGVLCEALKKVGLMGVINENTLTSLFGG